MAAWRSPGRRECSLERRSRPPAIARRQRVDVHPATGAIESHLSVDQRENRVIATEPDVLAGQKLRPALPDDDVARDHGFAAKFFHAEPFADAVAAVLDAALSLFMSHWGS